MKKKHNTPFSALVRREQRKAPFAVLVNLTGCPRLRGTVTFRSMLAAILFSKNVQGDPLLIPWDSASQMSDALLKAHGFEHIAAGVYRRAS